MNASSPFHAEQEILLSLALFDNGWDHVFITAKYYQCKPGKEEPQHFHKANYKFANHELPEARVGSELGQPNHLETNMMNTYRYTVPN